MKRGPKTFWAKVELWPPMRVRLHACHITAGHLVAMTDGEIADRSGLSAWCVFLLSQKSNWDDVDSRTMRAFMLACNCDVENVRDWARLKDYCARGGSFQHLRKSLHWMDYFKPLLLRWQWLAASKEYNERLFKVLPR